MAIQANGEQKRRKKPFHSTNVYLVLVDQFLEALEKNYGVTEEQVRRMNPAEINPVLRRFLHLGDGLNGPAHVVPFKRAA
jgi:hypothetical protein